MAVKRKSSPRIKHRVEDVTILGVIANGIEFGEKGLKFFVKQKFGC
jgi:hypothetical protein